MSDNRIRRFEKLWTSPAASVPAAESSHWGPSRDVPAGFAVFPLAHLPPEQQGAILAQGDLYQRAYDLARREAEETFIRDWVI